MTKILVSPSILAGDFASMGDSVRLIEENGADWVHCDVMDGVYVKNITFGMPMIAALRKITRLPLDVHLMITRPERYIDDFIKAGADIITFHPEASENPSLALEQIRKHGKKCGIVFNPDVEIAKYSYLFPQCDMILVMSVFAGLGGQKFIPYCLDRVREVRSILDGLGMDIPIEIDGGITEENAAEAIAAGCNVLVAGSSVYKAKNMRATISMLKNQNN